MAKERELELAERPAWGFWAALSVLVLAGGAAIWGAVTAPNPAAAWFFGAGAAFCLVLSCVGAYVLARPATIFVERGTLVARTPFSVRRLALSEVDCLEVKLRRTRGGIAYRELVVVEQGGVRRASIVADDFSNSRIAHFAKAAGLQFNPD